MAVIARISDIINKKEHDALHLTLSHLNLNPTELIYEDIKNRVAKECMSMNLKEIQMFCKKVLAEYTKEKWKNWCFHMKKLEKE
jgi:hypothetical protein